MEDVQERSLLNEKLEESDSVDSRQMTGSGALVDSLEKFGTEVVFGYIGGAIMPVFDELSNSEIRNVRTNHEQAAAHAADAYGRVTGKPGVCMSTSGPGAMNLMTGLANAFLDSSPLIALTGQVSTDLLGLDSFQEVDVSRVSKPITKSNYLLEKPEEVPQKMLKAFKDSVSGRSGPVLVDLPKDVQQSDLKYRLDVGSVTDFDGVGSEFSDDKVDLVMELVSDSERPVVLVGGGVESAGAEDELSEFVHGLDIPVVSSLMGLECFSNSDPLFLGMVGMHGSVAANKAVTNSDLLIAVGTRLDDRMTGKKSEFAPDATLVHVDIDSGEMGKILEPDVPVVGDAKKFLGKLNESSFDRTDSWGWLDTVSEWKDEFSYDGSDCLSPQRVVRLLDEKTSDSAIVTTGVGQHQMWVAQEYSFEPSNDLITSGGLGTMGFGFPAALGAKLGAPDREVVAVTGDGSFQMNVQELETFRRLDLDVTVVILRNNYLGMIRQWQELFFENNVYEASLRESPSLAKIAEAYGVHGVTVKEVDELEEKLVEALTHKGPSVVECFVEEEENVYPIVPPDTANKDLTVSKTDL